MGTTVGTIEAHLKLNARQFIGQAKQANAHLKRMTRLANQTRNSVIGLAGGMASIAGARAAVSVMADFEQSIAAVGGVGGFVGDELRELTSVARDMGATTEFSASQAAMAQLALVRAGKDLVEINSILPDVLAVATAHQLELAEAAAITVSTMNQFGLASSESQRVVDVLGNTANSTATTILEMSEGMKLVGSLAKTANIPLEETAAALGILADSTISSTRGGTGLRGILAALSKITPEAEAALAGYGLTAADVNIANVGLTGALKTLAQAQLSVEDRFRIFGKIAAPAISALITNVDKLDDLTFANHRAMGSTEDLAKIMRDTTSGSFKSFISALQELILQGGEAGALGTLRGMIDAGTDFMRWLAEVEAMSHVLPLIAAGAAGAGASMAVLGAASLVQRINALSLGISSVNRTLVVMRGVLAAHPIGALATVVGVATASLVLFTGGSDAAATAQNNLSAAIDDTHQSLEGIVDIRKTIAVAKQLGDTDREIAGLVRLRESVVTELINISSAASDFNGGVELRRQMTSLVSPELDFTSFSDIGERLQQLGVGFDDFVQKYGGGGAGALRRQVFTTLADTGMLQTALTERVDGITAQIALLRTATSSGGVGGGIALESRAATEALAGVHAALAEEHRLLRLSGSARDTAIKLSQIEQQLRSSGITLSVAQQTALRADVAEFIASAEALDALADADARAAAARSERASAQEAAVAAFGDQLAQMQFERSLIGLSNGARAESVALRQAEQSLIAAGITDRSAQLELMRAEIQAIQAGAAEQEKATTMMQQHHAVAKQIRQELALAGLDDLEQLRVQNELKLIQLQEARDADLISQQELTAAKILLSEQLADAEIQNAERATAKRMQAQMKLTGNLINLMGVLGSAGAKNDKKSFERNKRFQQIQTVINTAAAVMRAYSGEGGAWAAAVAASAGAIQLATISGSSFSGGGSVRSPSLSGGSAPAPPQSIGAGGAFPSATGGGRAQQTIVLPADQLVSTETIVRLVRQAAEQGLLSPEFVIG